MDIERCAALVVVGWSLTACAEQLGSPLPQGQSGSEPSPGQTRPSYASCPCGASGEWVLGTVVEVDEARLVLRVDDVLEGARLVAGEEVSAAGPRSLPCGGGCNLPVEAGQAVLARVMLSEEQLPCEARDACMAGCRADAQPRNCFEPCVEKTKAVCPEPNTEAWIGVTPWQEQLVVAKTPEAQLSVAADHLSDLWKDVGCIEKVGQAHELPAYPADTRPAREQQTCGQ